MNSDAVVLVNKGMWHIEGGWPKDVDCTDAEQTARHVRKVIQTCPLLQSLHMPLYHSNPEYHASFAWCLIDQTDQTSKDGSAVDESDGFEESSDQVPIPHEVLAQVNEEYRDVFLRSQPREGWSISDVELKIGKDVQTVPLRSA